MILFSITYNCFVGSSSELCAEIRVSSTVHLAKKMEQTASSESFIAFVVLTFQKRSMKCCDF